MAKHEIVIEHGNTSNSKLFLKGGDEISVKNGDKIIWSITAPNVKSFRIEKKDDSEEIFSILNRPPSRHTNKGEGRVKYIVQDGTEYEYSIFWKAEGDNDTEYKYDPKISVNSTLHGHANTLFIILIFVAGLFSLNFFRKKMKNR
jgi:hypothetical protein